MTALTASSEIQTAPNCGVKRVIVRTDANAATGFTYDASASPGIFSAIWAVYVCDNTGVVKTATWSGTTITLGTISTGIHTLIIEGV